MISFTFPTFPWEKDEFFIPKGEKSSGRLSFLLKYFKNPPVIEFFSKIGLEFSSNLSFFRLEFFSKCPKKKPVLIVVYVTNQRNNDKKFLNFQNP